MVDTLYETIDPQSCSDGYFRFQKELVKKIKEVERREGGRRNIEFPSPWTSVLFTNLTHGRHRPSVHP